MKLTWALLLTALCMGCTAKQSALEPANDIYKACVMGTIQAHAHALPAKHEIGAFMLSIDNTCAPWTHIWLKPLTGTKLTKKELAAFDKARYNLLATLAIEIELLK